MSVTKGIIKAPVNLKYDIGSVCKTGSGDLGYNIKSGKINIYARYKPVRSAKKDPLTEEELHMYNYGIYPGSGTGIINNIDMTKAEQDPYWHYKRPRGKIGTSGDADHTANEYFRASDFTNPNDPWNLPGYNIYAASPVKRTNLNDIRLPSGDIHVELDEYILNRDPNVEIPLGWINVGYADSQYVGFVLWDADQKKGYVLTTSNITLYDVSTGNFYNLDNPKFNVSIDGLTFGNGDMIHFYWALTNNPTTPERDADLVFKEIGTSAGQVHPNEVFLVATDENHGHCQFYLKSFDINRDLAFMGDVGTHVTHINGIFDSNGYQLTSFTTDLQCTYEWEQDGTEIYYMNFWLEAAGNTAFFLRGDGLTLMNAEQWHQIILDVGVGASWSTTELIDDQYKVYMYLYGRLTNETGTDESSPARLFATILYDVQNQTYTFTT